MRPTTTDIHVGPSHRMAVVTSIRGMGSRIYCCRGKDRGDNISSAFVMISSCGYPAHPLGGGVEIFVQRSARPCIIGLYQIIYFHNELLFIRFR